MSNRSIVTILRDGKKLSISLPSKCKQVTEIKSAQIVQDSQTIFQTQYIFDLALLQSGLKVPVEMFGYIQNYETWKKQIELIPMSVSPYGKKIIIVNKLVMSEAKNITTLDHFNGLCAARIYRCFVKHEFDWLTDCYEEVYYYTDKEHSYLNPEAIRIGIPRDDPLHWLYVRGFVYAFDLFPCEVIAISAFVCLHPTKSNYKELECKQVINELKSKIKSRFGSQDTSVAKIKGKLDINLENSEIYEKLARYSNSTFVSMQNINLFLSDLFQA